MTENRDFWVKFGLFGGCWVVLVVSSPYYEGAERSNRGCRRVNWHQVCLFTVVMVKNCRFEGEK